MEHYLYRAIQVVPDTPPYSIMEADILRPTAQSKPPSFYRDAVRHLHLDLDLDETKRSPEVLQVCTRARTFAATGQSGDPILLPVLLQMESLRHLSTRLADLFGGVDRIDMNHPILSSITHLDILDDLRRDRNARIWPHLTSLPALTHLCLNDRVPTEILNALLSDSSGIRILVNLWDSDGPAHGQILARNPPVKDPRFVVSVYREYDREWMAAVRGGAVSGALPRIL